MVDFVPATARWVGALAMFGCRRCFAVALPGVVLVLVSVMQVGGTGASTEFHAIAEHIGKGCLTVQGPGLDLVEQAPYRLGQPRLPAVDSRALG
ncbi:MULTISPECIES: hypothetical protein [Nocardioides]|uniref:Uncharacterized protein n=1 Tax=Nocardioides vastitatis TaxID=2568655 RepID=A0ABW0ZCS0_9ACTN|nr:hypothetical protein [Nocardioides sp.]THI95725.1 hypothetical protein E7Z54_18285 [Nocardioides sp.]